MKFKLSHRNIKHFAKVVNVFAKFGDDVRIYSQETGLVIEAFKDDSAYGCVHVDGRFFEVFEPEDPIDKRFKSKAINHVFKNPSGLQKHLNSLEFRISSNDDCVQVKQSMRRFNRILVIPEITAVRAQPIQLSPYKYYPCVFVLSCKQLFDALKVIPNSSGLASFRFRNDEVKIETGETEAEAEIYTHLQIYQDEFIDYKCEKPINVTINSRPLKAFLTAWDGKAHTVHCYFNEESHQVFEIVDIQRLRATLAVFNIEKEYQPDVTNSLNTSAFQTNEEVQVNRAPTANPNNDLFAEQNHHLISQDSSRRTFNINQTTNSPTRDEFDSLSGAAGSINNLNLSSIRADSANQQVNSLTQNISAGLRLPQTFSPSTDQGRDSINRRVNSTQTLGIIRPTNSTQTLSTNQATDSTRTTSTDRQVGPTQTGRMVTRGFDTGFYSKATYQSALRQLKLMGLMVDPSSSHEQSGPNTDQNEEEEEYQMSDNETFFDD